MRGAATYAARRKVRRDLEAREGWLFMRWWLPFGRASSLQQGACPGRSGRKSQNVRVSSDRRAAQVVQLAQLAQVPMRSLDTLAQRADHSASRPDPERGTTLVASPGRGVVAKHDRCRAAISLRQQVCCWSSLLLPGRRGKPRQHRLRRRQLHTPRRRPLPRRSRPPRNRRSRPSRLTSIVSGRDRAAKARRRPIMSASSSAPLVWFLACSRSSWTSAWQSR